MVAGSSPPHLPLSTAHRSAALKGRAILSLQSFGCHLISIKRIPYFLRTLGVSVWALDICKTVILGIMSEFMGWCIEMLKN